jgi:hypothetical protein
MSETVFDVVRANAFIGGLDFPTNGKKYYVRPKNGLDGNSGKSPRLALKTLAAAYAKCTAGKHDIVYLIGEGDASADCTDYQSSTADTAALYWNKDLTHLIGVSSGVSTSPRARIGFLSTFATASNLFKLGADGCRIENIQFWGGVNGHAQPIGCVEVTGRLNRFANCHIAGMNGAASVNDINGAYSLKLTGAIENEFHNCVIGHATSKLGANATNSQILFATLAQENLFKGCKIIMDASDAANHLFLISGSGGSVVWNIFEDCAFLNIGTTLTSAMDVNATGGLLLLQGTKTVLYGASEWDASDSGKIIGCGITKSAAGYGFSAAVAT